MQSFTISLKKISSIARSARYFLFALFVLCGICGANLFAADANLRDVHIKGDKDFLEILLLLDSSFENRVVKEDSKDFSSIIFKNLNYTKNKLATKSQLIKNIEIFARGNDVYVVLGEEDLDLRFELSVLSSPNALKISLKPKVSITQEILIKEIPNEIKMESSVNTGDSSNSSANIGANTNQTLEDSINALKAQNELLTPSNAVESWRYGLVVGILAMLIIALLIIKKRTQNQSPKSLVSYFKKPQITLTQSINIDMKNKIIILDSKDNLYILFVGQHNAFVIDTIVKNRGENLPQIINDKESKIINMLKAYRQNSVNLSADAVESKGDLGDSNKASDSKSVES